MININIALVFFSSIIFLIYGILCLVTPLMKNEFMRFGLTDSLRKLTGYLEILGGVGLVIGLKYPFLLMFSASGLSLLMLLGFFVRLRIKDGLLRSSPAFILMLLNLYLAYYQYQAF